MKQVEGKYAKEILKSPYKKIITSTKNKYYIMEDKKSLRILERVMNGEDVTRRGKSVV